MARLKLASTFLAATALCANMASAQTAPSPDAEDAADIVVTAQKRAQKLIDVPLSVTAIRGDELSKRGADRIEDLQFAVPGLTISGYSPGQSRPQIRGVSAFSGTPTVGTYLDELPLNGDTAGFGADVRLFDIQRIEVLRGPQGTLYGQGAMGGTLRYVTNEVDLDQYEASADGEVAGVSGGGTDWRVGSAVNVPMVTDRLGLRVAGTYQHFGGWIDNPLRGQKNSNSGRTYAIRGKLTAKFTDDFQLTITAQHQRLRVGAQNVSDDNQEAFFRAATPQTDKTTYINAVATYDFGPVTLLSSTGLINRRALVTTDVSQFYIPFLEAPLPFGFGFPAGTFDNIAFANDLKQKIFTQEVRLSSNGTGPLTYTIGGFYRSSRNPLTTTVSIDPDVLPFVLFGGNGTAPYNSKSWAVFGEASYEVVPTLTALVGLRYFHDRLDYDNSSTSFGVSARDVGTGKFNALNPRFNLAWQPNDQVNIYANVAKGFRSGGFNPTSFGAGAGVVPPTYKPDSLWTYELGGKFQSADRKFSAELAGYRNVWNNIQAVTNVPGQSLAFTTNSGKLLGWGADGAITYSPSPALLLTATAGYNHSRYRSTTAEHLPGDPADYVPRFTGSASAEYRFEIAGLSSFVRADYQHSDHYQVYLRNFQVAPAKSDAIDTINLRGGVSNGGWSLNLFVKNLTNKDSIIYPAFSALPYPGRLEPRQIGASFSIGF